MSTDRDIAIETNPSLPGMSEEFHLRPLGGVGKPSLTNNMLVRLQTRLRYFLSARVRNGARSVQLAHDETAFRFLLANEAKRSERSGRSFHILLTYCSGPGGEPTRMDGEVTRTLLPILSGVLRETDYIGWYRDGHVLGGVMTALGDHPTEEISHRVEQRFWWRIGREYSSREFANLRVRFFPAQDFERIDTIDRLGARN
jgi:hypothetical protein